MYICERRVTKWEADLAHISDERRITKFADAVADVAERPKEEETSLDESPKEEESPNNLSTEVQEIINALARGAVDHWNKEESDPQFIEQVHEFSARFFAAVTGNHAAEF